MESPGQCCQTTHDSCGLRTRLNARPAGFADREMLAGCQVADIGHCALPMHIHVEWVKRLEDEFFAQVGPPCAGRQGAGAHRLPWSRALPAEHD